MTKKEYLREKYGDLKCTDFVSSCAQCPRYMDDCDGNEDYLPKEGEDSENDD